MIKIIVIIVCVLVSILFGYKLTEIEGRVIIDFSGTIIQASLLGSFIILIFSVFVALLLWWALKKLIRTASGPKTWIGRLSKRQQIQAFYQSINAMLMNEQQEARKLIRKTTKGDFQGTNYLIAAELERQAGESQQAQAYLIQAMDYPKSEPLALMKQAELCLNNDQSQEAMNLLASVEGKVRNTKSFVSLKLNVLEGLNDWGQIQSLAKEHKKLLGDDYFTWSRQWTIGEFAAIASKQGANALKSHWQQLGRGERKDQSNQLAYLQLLIDQGLSAEAEKELVTIAGRQQHEGYWHLFKQLNHPNPTLAIKFIEQEIKKSPEDGPLYSVLANLAYNTADYELANKAVSKALELDNKATDKALLACILEKKNDFEQANVVYKGLLK
ncbi:MAG: HemY protein [Alphaproteobacteria bacterium]|jgi:HemY protein